jgi:uridine phosphorylase
MQNTYPILEFDPAPEAVIEPSKLIEPIDAPEHCVICFFQEVIARVRDERNAKVIASHRWEDAAHPIYEIEVDGYRLAFVHPGVGSPMALPCHQTLRATMDSNHVSQC